MNRFPFTCTLITRESIAPQFAAPITICKTRAPGSARQPERVFFASHIRLEKIYIDIYIYMFETLLISFRTVLSRSNHTRCILLVQNAWCQERAHWLFSRLFKQGDAKRVRGGNCGSLLVVTENHISSVAQHQRREEQSANLILLRVLCYGKEVHNISWRRLTWSG